MSSGVRNALLVIGATGTFGTSGAGVPAGSLRADFAATGRPVASIVDFTVGLSLSDTVAVFGIVGAVAVDPDGYIFVLDARSGTVHVMEQTGEIVASLPPKAPARQSPARPVALAVDASGVLYLLDRGGSAIERWTRVGPKFKRAEPLQLSLPSRGICALGTRLFSTGFHDGADVHELSPRGTQIASFGRVHPFTDEALRRFVSGDFIGCGASTLVVASRWLPDVQGFSPDGTRTWEVALPGFEPVIIEPTRTGFGFHVPPGGYYDLIENLAVLGGDTVLVQLARQTGRHNVRRTHTFVIDARSGTVIRRLERALPRIYASLPDGRWVASTMPDRAALRLLPPWEVPP